MDGGIPTSADGLVSAADSDQARALVAELERRGCTWVPLGGREGNFGLVNIGSDPGLAFVERITNAIDGVLERAARDAGSARAATLETPREAARELFGILDGRLAALDDDAIEGLANSVMVTISDGSSAARPTLSVRDRGVGIAGDKMRTSILDLAGSNKLDKPYLAGAYGQGGSTTFGFTARGSIVASSPNGVDGAATFVRYSSLDPRKNKNGRYEYLVDRDGAVPRFNAAAVGFERGTLVRHFDFELPRHLGAIATADGLLGLASAALFDPVLPVTLIDERKRRREPRAVIFAGAARRLGRNLGDIALHQTLSIPFGKRGRAGLVAIRYWLLAAREGAEDVRPDERHVVFVTNFGQTHDAWPRSFAVDDLRMPFLKNALVVQVELDGLGAATKRELLSTTRDRLKRGSAFTVLYDAVRDALADERALVEANAERRRALLDRQRAADHEKLQRRFAELMKTFRPGQVPAAARAGHAAAAELSRDSGSSGEDASPLPTLEHPTFLRFAESNDLELPSGRALRVALESDAPDGYLSRYPDARVIAAPDPPLAVAFVRASDFRGGRARIVVRAEGDVGTKGILASRFTTASGDVLLATRPFAIVEAPAPIPSEGEGKAGIAVPKVYPVTRDRWPDHGFNEATVATVSESIDDFTIAVNVDNMHLHRLVESVAYQQTGLTRMRSAFVVQAAYYAFLLHREHDRSSKSIDSEVLEQYEIRELDRVAQTIVSSIASIERIDSAALFETEA
jgi:hypothetical protein